MWQNAIENFRLIAYGKFSKLSDFLDWKNSIAYIRPAQPF